MFVLHSTPFDFHICAAGASSRWGGAIRIVSFEASFNRNVFFGVCAALNIFTVVDEETIKTRQFPIFFDL